MPDDCFGRGLGDCLGLLLWTKHTPIQGHTEANRLGKAEHVDTIAPKDEKVV